MKLTFLVEGKPPRKDGANSMWNKDDEAMRLVTLRRKAVEAKQEYGITGCVGPFAKLELTVFSPIQEIERIGDLDNFVTGICDGLQAAHPRASLHQVFSNPENEMIHPSKPVLLINDSSVIEIVARKRVQPDNGTKISYMVALESLSQCY